MRWTGAVVTASVASLILVATVYAGGWMIMTLRDLPEYAVAGRPIQLTFMVREHGVSPLDGLTPKIAAKSGTKVVETSAVATKSPGEYTATLALPDPGSWTIEFDPTDFVLPELTVIAPGSPAPPPLSEASLGERLFVAKGCIGCHINRELEARNLYDVGPDLTGKRFPETYLKSLLVDPKATLRRDSDPDREEMPNLGLTTGEIAALTAFINRDRPLPPRCCLP
jgi:Cytochrome c